MRLRKMTRGIFRIFQNNRLDMDITSIIALQMYCFSSSQLLAK